MHDRPANEVTMEKSSARLIGRALASAGRSAAPWLGLLFPISFARRSRR